MGAGVLVLAMGLAPAGCRDGEEGPPVDTPAPSAATSSLVVLPGRVVADGIDAAVATVTIRDGDGAPLDGIPVSMEADAHVEPAAGITGDDGTFTATLTNTLAGTRHVVAHIDDDAFSLTAYVAFVPAPPAAFGVQVVPDLLTPGTPADLLIDVVDPLGNRVTDWEGTVVVQTDAEGAGTPGLVPFTEEDQGSRSLTGAMVFPASGTYGVTAFSAEDESIVGATTVVVEAGVLADVGVSVSHLGRGARGALDLTFETGSATPPDSAVVLHLPDGFDASGASLAAVDVAGADGPDAYALEVTGPTLRVTRVGAAPLPDGTAFHVRFEDVRNPWVEGATGFFEAWTETGDGGRIDHGTAEGPTLGPASLSFEPLVTTRLIGPGLGVTADADTRRIIATGLVAGRWYGFALIENGRPAEGLECDDLPAHGSLQGTRLLVDLGPREEAGAERFDCVTDAGPLVVDLEYEGAQVALVSGWRFADPVDDTVGDYDGGSSYFPAVSADGSVVAREAYLLGRLHVVVTFAGDDRLHLGSADGGGQAADDHSRMPSLSADGRYLAFVSYATNLVPGLQGRRQRVFVKDLTTGDVVLASAAADGSDADSTSTHTSLSADGRYVAFSSSARNLVPEADTANSRVYVKDLLTGDVVLASATSDGSAASGNEPSLSADGRFVAFSSWDTDLVPGTEVSRKRVFVKDVESGTLVLASSAPDGSDASGISYAPSLSGDGLRVAFRSAAGNLVPGVTGGVFVKDLEGGDVTVASTSEDGTAANDYSTEPSLSAAGRFVAFRSRATNLLPDLGFSNVWRIFVKDLETGAIRLASAAADGSAPDGEAFDGVLAADAGTVVFRSTATSLTPGTPDVRGRLYSKDLDTGAVARAGTGHGADTNALDAAMPSISADGRFVAFASDARNLLPWRDGSGVYVRDLETGETILANVAEDGTAAPGTDPSISADGRYVAFRARTRLLVEGTPSHRWHVYVKDLSTGTVALGSASVDGTPADADSETPRLSADGRSVAFRSAATNLWPGEDSALGRVYVKDLETGALHLASANSDGTAADGDSAWPSLSGDGLVVAFQSSATNLVPGADTANTRLYVKDLVGGGIEMAAAGGHHASLSGDGRRVAYRVGGLAGQILVQDLDGGDPVLASADADGEPGDGDSQWPILSGDGRFVAFRSRAGNLVSSTTPDRFHIYVRDLDTGVFHLASRAQDGSEADAHSDRPAVSGDGGLVAFESHARNLVPGIDAHRRRIYVRALSP